MRYWHNRLNQELFQGKLGRVGLTFGDSTDIVDCPVEGYYLADPYEPRIHIDARCTIRRRVINTLAHEMVHQYQHELGVPLTHGKFFKAQAKRLAKHGIII